jgi:dihydroorotase
VDLHAHFRDPGFTHKEDILSGSRAAAAGGYTVVSVMANTDPVCDCPEVARYVHERAREVGLVELFPVGAITERLKGEALSDMEGLAPHVWAFSDDGTGVQRDDVMLLACQKGASLGRPLIEHCETQNIEDRTLSETLMVARDLVLANYTGCTLHIAHVSTTETVDMIVRAKRNNVPVTCEVTPHHVCVDEEVGYTVNPPLVDHVTRESLGSALVEGLIDVVATDHAPHTLEDKAKGAPGISGIETAFALLYTQLVRTEKLSLSQLSRTVSLNPAHILNLPKGELQTGYDGDVVLVEEDESFTVSADRLVSKGKNTPLLGTSLTGKIWATIHKGEILIIDGKIKGRDFDDYRQVV